MQADAAPEPPHAAASAATRRGSARRARRLDEPADPKITRSTGHDVGRRRDPATGTVRVQRRSHGPHSAAGRRPGAGPRVNVGDDVQARRPLFALSSREVAAAVAEHLASHKDLELVGEDLRDDQGSVRAPGGLAHGAAAGRKRARQGARESRRRPRKCCTCWASTRRRRRATARLRRGCRYARRLPERSSNARSPTDSSSAPRARPSSLSPTCRPSGSRPTSSSAISTASPPGRRPTSPRPPTPTITSAPHVSRIGTVVDAQTRTAKMRFAGRESGTAAQARDVHDRWSLHRARRGRRRLTVPAKAVFVENGKSLHTSRPGRRVRAPRDRDARPRIGDRLRVVARPARRRPGGERRRAAAPAARNRRERNNDPPDRLVSRCTSRSSC